METKDLVYKRSGRKYIPYGVCYAPEYLTPGLWYCNVKPGCRGYTNADKYIGSLLKVSDIDLPIVKQCEQYKVAQKILDNFDFSKSQSMQEIVTWVVGEVFRICNKENGN